jgi:fibrillarin-like rRNA methylase
MVQRAFVTNEFASRLAYSKSRRRLAPLHSDAAAARSYARVVEMGRDLARLDRAELSLCCP